MNNISGITNTRRTFIDQSRREPKPKTMQYMITGKLLGSQNPLKLCSFNGAPLVISTAHPSLGTNGGQAGKPWDLKPFAKAIGWKSVERVRDAIRQGRIRAKKFGATGRSLLLLRRKSSVTGSHLSRSQNERTVL